MGNIAIIFAIGVLVIFLALPTLMETIFASYPVGTGYHAYNGWRDFMKNLGWFYYLLGVPLAAVAYAGGHKLEEGGMGGMMQMGIGKIFMGLGLIVGWIVAKFGIMENKSALSIFIADPAQRFALLESFHGIEPVIWIVVLMAAIGLMIWGTQS